MEESPKKSLTPAEQAALRRRENQRIVTRVMTGQSIAMVDTQATWWPSRPKIEKDPELVKRVYGDDVQEPKEDKGARVLSLVKE